ncbi:hypothetical protein D3C80_328480 [compost metagenome]
MACQNDHEVKFYYLEKHTKQADGFNIIHRDDSLYGNKLYETVLVRNPPATADSLKQLMLHYFDTLNNRQNKGVIFAYRSIDFYRYTSETNNFLHSTKDPYQLANVYLWDYSEAYLGNVYYQRCPNDSLKIIKTIYLNQAGQTDTLTNECLK